MGWIKRQYGRTGMFLRREVWGLAWFCGGVFLATGLICYLLLRRDPERLNQLLQGVLQIFEQKGIQDSGDVTPWLLMANNLRATGLTVLLGIIPFLFLPLLVLAENVAVLSIGAASYQAVGLPMKVFWAGLLPHGVLELPAIVLSGILGCYLCREMIKIVLRSHSRQRMDQLLEKSLSCYFLVVVPLVVAAAFLEAWVTPVVMGWVQA